MKRLFSMRLTSLLGAAAFTIAAVTSTAALAQPYQPGPPGYSHPPGPGPGYGPGPGHRPRWHQWHRGDRYNGSRYVVHNWQHYRLRPPPPGYQWVQNGGQFVLIAVASGIVADIILNSQYH
jgi:hypothetical protein